MRSPLCAYSSRRDNAKTGVNPPARAPGSGPRSAPCRAFSPPVGPPQTAWGLKRVPGASCSGSRCEANAAGAIGPRQVAAATPRGTETKRRRPPLARIALAVVVSGYGRRRGEWKPHFGLGVRQVPNRVVPAPPGCGVETGAVLGRSARSPSGLPRATRRGARSGSTPFIHPRPRGATGASLRGPATRGVDCRGGTLCFSCLAGSSQGFSSVKPGESRVNLGVVGCSRLTSNYITLMPTIGL